MSALARYESASTRIHGIEVPVMRTDFAGVPGFDLVVAGSDTGTLSAELSRHGEGLGLEPVGTEALDMLRIEHGVPTYGSELTEEVNPLEAGLVDFISFNKGCYIGQEVVARLNTYDKVQRQLVLVSWTGSSDRDARAALFLDGDKVGEIPSETWSPRLDRSVALGYVRKAQAQPGTRLMLDSTVRPVDV